MRRQKKIIKNRNQCNLKQENNRRVLPLSQHLPCYTDSIILKHLEFKANISLVWPIDSYATDLPQKSARKNEFGGQCPGLASPSVSQQCRSYSGQPKRTSSIILTKMPRPQGASCQSWETGKQCCDDTTMYYVLWDLREHFSWIRDSAS